MIWGFDYHIDPTGNRLGVTEATGQRTTWTYDNSYQLINEHRSGADGFNTTFVYDPVGNRLEKNASGVVTISTYDVANQLVTSVGPAGTVTYTFDAAGNQQTDQAPEGSTTRTWNYENQNTGVVLPTGQRVTMSYSADFRRVRKE